MQIGATEQAYSLSLRDSVPCVIFCLLPSYVKDGLHASRTRMHIGLLIFMYPIPVQYLIYSVVASTRCDVILSACFFL